MSADATAAYARIADELRDSILSRVLFPGDPLPSEHELALRYGTSRVTVRKALGVLCGEQLVYAHQGKGYFVKKPDYNRYSMIFELIRPEHTVHFRRVAVVGATERVASRLRVEEGADVVSIRLVVFLGDIAVACEDKFLPYKKGFPLIESVTHRADYPDLVDRKLWRILLQCELRLRPGRLDAEQARMLGCPEDEPVLLVERVIKSDEGHVVGFSRSFLLEAYGPLGAESGYAASSLISPVAH